MERAVRTRRKKPRESSNENVPVLRLRRGASAVAQWTLGHEEGGTVVTLGADPSCDWHVTAAGVGPLELTFFFVEGELLVKSERPGSGARLNGERLAEDWAVAREGSRIDCGTACIEVTFAPKSKARDAERKVAEERAPTLGSEDPNMRDALESGVRRRPTEARPPQALLVPRDVPPLAPETDKRAFDELDAEVHLPTILISQEAYEEAPASAQQAAPPSDAEFKEARASWPPDETTTPNYEVSVALLPQEDRDMRLLRHALLGIALGLAYVCWVWFSDL